MGEVRSIRSGWLGLCNGMDELSEHERLRFGMRSGFGDGSV